MDDFAALGTLAEHAVDATRTQTHDAMARSVRDGAGGVYALLAGESGVAGGHRTGWVGWFSKRDDVRYPQLHDTLTQAIENSVIFAVWQRQLVLGPAPEFRVLAAGPVTVSGADLAAAAHVSMSG